jgi:hypothetical protein
MGRNRYKIQHTNSVVSSRQIVRVVDCVHRVIRVKHLGHSQNVGKHAALAIGMHKKNLNHKNTPVLLGLLSIAPIVAVANWRKILSRKAHNCH